MYPRANTCWRLSPHGSGVSEFLEEAAQVAPAWSQVVELRPLGEGHIHDTYRVKRKDGSYSVLQKFNEYVFRDSALVMAQTERWLQAWTEQDQYTVPELLINLAGDVTVRNESGLWRMWRYVEGSRVVDPVSNVTQALEVGKAFAAFQVSLETMSGDPFTDPIDGFLDLGHYLDAFAEVATRAPRDARAIIDAQSDVAGLLSQRHCHIHGDCKVNNALFDASEDRVAAIIDFDTAMYGHWAWDFGDLIRSVCFSSGGYDASLYQACLQGFIENQPRANVAEAVIAPRYVTLMLGIRFLTDHLSGDQYFKVDYPGENLYRAEGQFALLREFDANQGAMARLADAAFRTKVG